MISCTVQLCRKEASASSLCPVRQPKGSRRSCRTSSPEREWLPRGSRRNISDLASFPHQQLDVYLPKLVRAGLRVAIVDEPLKNDIKTSKMQESRQEKEAEDRMKVLVEQLNKRLVPVKAASSLERTHYDAAKDIFSVQAAP